MSISIPTSMFGVIAFLVVGSLIISSIISSEENYKSDSERMIEGINDDLRAIKEIGESSENTTSTGFFSFITDDVSGISNVAKIIWYGFNIVLEYIFLPFYMLLDFIGVFVLLPPDLASPVTILVGTGVIAGVALLLRGIGRT